MSIESLDSVDDLVAMTVSLSKPGKLSDAYAYKNTKFIKITCKLQNMKEKSATHNTCLTTICRALCWQESASLQSSVP